MSRSQPLCDGSHRGTKFKPLKFRIEQQVDTIHLCECKLSTTAPFCDATTCQKINSNSLSLEDLTLEIQEQTESKVL
ncbi:unnamed protein product [Moneuplotes crassus]|uniref:Iron-binding zinc finger CDGSH type domain-containing protein n=1 Tax=Euplotes crassus TaxID=5936 RepID=A0AAD1X9T2_EUPCR|nr:unnamed protein product [Moneuplotes crassus]